MSVVVGESWIFARLGYWYKCTIPQCGRHVTMTEDNSETNYKLQVKKRVQEKQE